MDKDDIQLAKRFDLHGKTALITGSARGIGRAIAIGLAEFGCRVIVHGSRDSEPLRTALEKVKAFSPESFSVYADLNSREAVDAMLREIAGKGISPDILVANASVQYRVPWDKITEEEALTQMRINFHATLQLVQGLAPAMIERKWGRIVTVGSVQERRPHPQMAVYAASKGAQENLVRNLAFQFAQYRVTVNNLCPGVFATDRNAEALDNPVYAKQVTDAIPLHDYALPADAAGAALLLCSEAGRYITGATLMVDGGLSLPK